MFSDALGTLVIMRMCPPNTGAGVGGSGQRVLKKPPSSVLWSDGIKKKKFPLTSTLILAMLGSLLPPIRASQVSSLLESSSLRSRRIVSTRVPLC